jgi:hypothetical protein
MTDKRCFLQWFVLSLAFVTAAFFAGYYGLFQMIWNGDVTHVTSGIAVVFLASCLYLGFASWRFDASRDAPNRAAADSNIGRTSAFLVTLLGLLGTAIGLMFQVKALGSLDVSNPQAIVGFISSIGSSLSTALYATACGIVACIGITVMNSNLEYFIDLDAES